MPGVKPFAWGKTIVHMHIPKSAGTSMNSAIMAAVSPKRPHVGIGPMIFGSFGDFDTIPASTREMIFLTSDVMRVDADYVGGHVDFGVLETCYPHGFYLTVVREPVCRLLSNWLFWRSWPWPTEDFWGAWGNVIHHSRWSLRDFLNDKSNATNTDNLTARMLLGVTNVTPEADFIREEDNKAVLNAAMLALDRFAFIDIAENPRLFPNLSEWLGVEVGEFKENELMQMPEEFRGNLAAELDEETMELAQHRSRLDLQIWQHVARLAGFDPEPLRIATLAKCVARSSAIFG